MYVILGATGHIGSQLAKILLDAGKPVRVVGRSADRLVPLQSKGADPFAGDVLDTDFLVKTFTGATAVFSLIPPNPAAKKVRSYQNDVSKSIEKAIKDSGVTSVVNISSVGAELDDRTGPGKGLHDHEERLNKIKGLNVAHLRAGYFMENIMFNINLIRSQGINGSAIKGDLKMPVIATRDIAAVAAQLLLSGNFKGTSVKYLLGERDLTMVEMTRILGKSISKPDLKYVQFPYGDAEKAMIGMGLSPDTARSYVELSRAFNDGIIKKITRTDENTTPTSIEWFADIFASAYCENDASCKASGF